MPVPDIIWVWIGLHILLMALILPMVRTVSPGRL